MRPSTLVTSLHPDSSHTAISSRVCGSASNARARIRLKKHSEPISVSRISCSGGSPHPILHQGITIGEEALNGQPVPQLRGVR